jgi:hypothetical protein
VKWIIVEAGYEKRAERNEKEASYITGQNLRVDGGLTRSV